MKRFSKGLISIIAATLVMGTVALPDSIKSNLPDAPVLNWIKSQKTTLGLDLQGGTQLDYRIDLSGVEERNNDGNLENDLVVRDVVEGVRSTIVRRVDGLGVSEPNIYTSDVAGEKHIIVELAGIKDVDEAKAVVGKTIQLEFKELKTEEDPEFVSKIREEAQATLNRVLEAPDTFELVAEEVKTADNRIEHRATRENFESQLPNNQKEALVNMEVGQIFGELVENSGDFAISGNGQIVERKGFIALKLEGKELRDRTETTDEEVRASHILIAYEGAQRSEQTRSKTEAFAEAERLLAELKAAPDTFAAVATENSDGPSASSGGDLDFFGRGVMAPAFETAAFGMEVDQISEVVETDFGYHIIQVTDKKEAVETTTQENFYTYSEILYDTSDDPWKATGLDGSQFRYATVVYDHIGTPQVSIQFDDEGSKLFEEITERLNGQQLAIFVGGELISAPRVNQKITGGNAVITGNFSLQEALQLSNDLNTGAIDAPIVLSGQNTISASLGENALNLSLYAGLIGLIALAIFMVLYYRLMGVFAVIALAIYSVIIVFIIKTTGIVMSLAGIAGIILSIGMAVDANILIFERTKEELADGSSYLTAISTGFDRAWSSIRDSNVSSLITCVILWFFGNSIVRGFALMLGIGILVSMFTAITVTKSFLQTVQGTKISKNNFLVGGPLKKKKAKK